MNAAGVDIAPFSSLPHEEEVLLLPGLPLVNFPGNNPEPDLWTFEVETPDEFVESMDEDEAPVMIDYVHPGAVAYCSLQKEMCRPLPYFPLTGLGHSLLWSACYPSQIGPRHFMTKVGGVFPTENYRYLRAQINNQDHIGPTSEDWPTT